MIVEFLASVVMEDNDYDYSFSKRYHYPLFLVLRFMLISSDNDFFELVFYGKFYDWLDNLTKPGCAKKLQYCLHLCSLGSNLNDLLMVIEDIVAHAVRCFLDNIDSKNKRQKVIFSYRAIVVDELLIYEFDFNYLSDVLNFEL